MKKEYFFFLTLLLAAAVVTGTTIGMISNLNYLVHETDILNVDESKQLDNDSSNNSDENAETVSKSENETASSNPAAPTIKISSASTESEIMIVSRDEQREVMLMLNTLGVSRGTGYSEQIREFQSSNNLEPTGSLDSLTLDALIQQVRLHQTTEKLKS